MVHEVGQRQSAVRVCACWVEDSVLAHVKQQQQQEQEKRSRKTTTATVCKQSQFLFVLQFALSGFFICKDARNQVVETYHDKARTRGQVRE